MIGILTNAFVFSELQIVLKDLSKTEVEIERRLIENKQAMLNMRLPATMQPNVLDHLMSTAPSHKVQIDIQNFVGLMSPSLIFKVVKRLFNDRLQNNGLFYAVENSHQMEANQKEIHQILEYVDMQFYRPEIQLMKQYDSDH